MKINRVLTLIFAVVICLPFYETVAAQDDSVNKQLAKRIVRSAGVKQGEVVVIEGGKHMVPLMEAAASEVIMTGGIPVMILDSDRVQRVIYKDAPDSYLEQVPTFWAEWFKHANVFIGLPAFQDNKALVDGVPPERFAKFSKSYDFFAGVINSLPIREVDIDFPTPSAAEANGMELAAYQKVIFEGINADYNVISQQGAKLQQMLQSAKSVRVTSPNGTDITFSMAPGRNVFVDDGMITEEEGKSKMFTGRYVLLPGGSVYFAPLESSANGRVVVPRTRCRFNRVRDVSFDIKNGKLQNMKGSPDVKCFEEELKPYTGPKDVFGSFWIGLNPSLRNVEDDKADFRHFNVAGMVNVGFGDNRTYGGVNDSNIVTTFPLSNATVTIDGKTVVKDGKLVL